jgi:hypothetical protein
MQFIKSRSERVEKVRSGGHTDPIKMVRGSEGSPVPQRLTSEFKPLKAAKT